MNAPAETLPVNPSATKDCKDVLAFLERLSNNLFNGVIIGQNCGHGPEIVDKYPRYIGNLQAQTGKLIGLVGVDYEYMEEYSSDDLSRANQKLIEHWNNGGLVTINMTPTCPLASDGNVYNKTGNQLEKLITPGNRYYNGWKNKLDRIAGALRELRDEGVVVLWRPLQEHNGTHNKSFWYSAKYNSEADVRAVYRHMFQYFTEDKGLNNLLWVYSPLGGGSQWGYPGDDYVDIVAGTSYGDDLTIWGYDTACTYEKPLGVGEYGHDFENAYGNFDMREYVAKIRDKYPRLAYFVCWHSWENSEMAIVENKHASDLLEDVGILTAEDLTWQRSANSRPGAPFLLPKSLRENSGELRIYTAAGRQLKPARGFADFKPPHAIHRGGPGVLYAIPRNEAGRTPAKPIVSVFP